MYVYVCVCIREKKIVENTDTLSTECKMYLQPMSPTSVFAP